MLNKNVLCIFMQQTGEMCINMHPQCHIKYVSTLYESFIRV